MHDDKPTPSLHLLEVGVTWPPEPFLARKLAGLAQAGMRVTVASKEIRDPAFVLPGVAVLALDGRGVPRALLDACVLAARSPRRLVRLLFEIFRAPKRLRRRHGGRRGLLASYMPIARVRPDVVQFEWNVAAVDHLPLFAFWRCPILTSCRGSDLAIYPHVPSLSEYTAQLPEIMRRAAAVHCVSESQRVEALRFGVTPGKTWIIHPAVDPDVFRPDRGPSPRPASAMRVVLVGGPRWEKGYEFALTSIRALLDAGIAVGVEMIGLSAERMPVEEQRIRHCIRDLALADHVALLPSAAAAEIRQRLNRADVLLHPSLSEGISNAVLEAMACGVPVVATRCGGLAEAVTDGVEGLLVAPRDPRAMTLALHKLWHDPGLRAAMGAAGRRRVRQGFSLAQQLAAFQTMYETVVS
jgi:colanic acid/amylovoran biosynthesis glycosyltransferase